MAQDWKNTILQRMKQRNVAQSQRYEQVLTSYNALVDEKNKLTAIIASFTSENVFMLNGKHLSFSLSRRENSIPNLLNHCYAQREDYGGDNLTHRDMSLSVASGNDATTEGSPGEATTPSGATAKTQDRLTNGLSKRELLQVIKEKAKADQLILLLKNDINEKKKVLSILNKHNKTLNDTLVKKEQQLNDKKEKLSKLQNVISRQEKEIKLYATCNVSLKRKIKWSQKKKQKVINEFDAIRLSYFKIWKEAFQLKKCKKNLEKDYFAIRNELLQKKIENEKLLQCLLKIKKEYRRHLIKVHTLVRQRNANYSLLSEKNPTHKRRFPKRHKFFLTLYWDKLHYMYNYGEPPWANAHHSQRKNNVLAKKRNNLLVVPSRSSHAEKPPIRQDIPQVEKSQWGENAPAPEAPHASGKNKYSVLREHVQVAHKKGSFLQNGRGDYNHLGAISLGNSCHSNGRYQTVSNDPTQFVSNGLRRPRFHKIKGYLSVHTSSSVLCFSAFPGTCPQVDSHKYVKQKWGRRQRTCSSDKENQLDSSGLANHGESGTSLLPHNNDCDSDLDMLSSVGSDGDYSELRDPRLAVLPTAWLPHPTDTHPHNALVTCAEDGSIAFVKIKKEKMTCIKRFQIGDQKIAATNVCVHPTSKHSLLSLTNNTICLINNGSGQIENWYHSHDEKITSINFLHHLSYADELPPSGSPADSPFFYSTSLDKTVKLFHLERGSLYSLLRVNDAVTCSCKSNKQPLVLIGTRSGSIICYDLRIHNRGVTQSALYQKNIFDDEISGVTYSPDDTLIAIQSIGGKTKLLNANKINFFQCLERPDFLKNESPTCAPVFSADGNELICTFPYTLIAHDVVTHSYVSFVNDELAQVNGAHWLSGGNLCTIHADGNVAIW
ncbi:hypothetical protein C922_04986 [Plasmodium inui San Antonio 1]|uniref:Uncharacterized protein n=1 Tax=Plasmodium inui San Antonio 1 TaxID=1237626 RepID=W6ZZD8_9APIC|nr:hypothetical protein C922_04986 [Plasmodium inui San Antonio 1]EUD64640.1 hypothetical protein C922_04986 [Plasmodium inui San Antonio 1]